VEFELLEDLTGKFLLGLFDELRVSGAAGKSVSNRFARQEFPNLGLTGIEPCSQCDHDVECDQGSTLSPVSLGTSGDVVDQESSTQQQSDLEKVKEETHGLASDPSEDDENGHPEHDELDAGIDGGGGGKGLGGRRGSEPVFEDVATVPNKGEDSICGEGDKGEEDETEPFLLDSTKATEDFERSEQEGGAGSGEGDTDEEEEQAHPAVDLWLLLGELSLLHKDLNVDFHLLEVGGGRGVVEEDAGADVDDQKDDGEAAADGDHAESDGIGDGVDADGVGLAGGCGEGTTIKGSEKGSRQEEGEDTDAQEGVVQVGAGFIKGELHNAGTTRHEGGTGDEEKVEECDTDDSSLEKTEITTE